MGSQDEQNNDCQSPVRETFAGRDISESFFGHRRTATRVLSVTRQHSTGGGKLLAILNFWRNLGEPRVFLKQIAIGHAGDVIADRAMQSLHLHSLRGRFAKLAWIDNVAFENL